MTDSLTKEDVDRMIRSYKNGLPLLMYRPANKYPGVLRNLSDHGYVTCTRVHFKNGKFIKTYDRAYKFTLNNKGIQFVKNYELAMDEL